MLGTTPRVAGPTFLKPGDVTIFDIEGIGTMTTPFKALSEQLVSLPGP